MDIIDVDADENVVQPQRPAKRASTPISISDDESEMMEVDAKLAWTTASIPARSYSARSYSANSNVGIRGKATPSEPEIIDLVSDDDIMEISGFTEGRTTRRDTSTANAKPRAETTAARTKKLRKGSANAGKPSGAKPGVNGSGPSRKIIYKGPPSSILPHVRVKKQSSTPKPLVVSPPLTPVDSEDEYEHTAHFNPDPFRHPTESPENDCRLEAPAPVAPLSEPYPVRPLPSNKRRYVDISNHLPASPILSRTDEVFIWDLLQNFNVLPHFRPRPRFLARKRPRLAEALDLDHYKSNYNFRRSGGAINKILQHNGRVVVCSNTAGGTITGDSPDPYNKAGTLISWSKRDPLKILDLEQGLAQNLYGTHYSVYCIAYDPISNTLASSAADQHVRTWTFKDDGDEDDDHYTDPQSPYESEDGTALHDLAFKPGAGEPILAIGEQNLTVQNLATRSQHTFSFGKQAGYVTGAITWGSGRSSSTVFALSEPVGQNRRNGYHMAFDTQACKTAFKFDATGAGDSLCVDTSGTTVAIVTDDGSDSYLQIYDVARTRGKTVQKRCLEPFASEGREVNSMAFSPDSIYLAVGRDDNCTHVYDSRMLGRGVLFDFQHAKTRFTAPEQFFFGVVGVEWVESRFNRLGLVTGGNDGCVRLWDPLRAKDEGTVLAQANSDIAYFTIGDPYKGDHGLVVGDSDGAIYVMDGHSIGSI